MTVICKDKKTYNKIVKMLKKAGAKKAKFKFKKGSVITTSLLSPTPSFDVLYPIDDKA